MFFWHGHNSQSKRMREDTNCFLTHSELSLLCARLCGKWTPVVEVWKSRRKDATAREKACTVDFISKVQVFCILTPRHLLKLVVRQLFVWCYSSEKLRCSTMLAQCVPCIYNPQKPLTLTKGPKFTKIFHDDCKSSSQVARTKHVANQRFPKTFEKWLQKHPYYTGSTWRSCCWLKQ